MTETVTALLAELDLSDPARAVHAELARKLAATLDRMGPSVAARMSGQTAGALLRTLDKLGAQRGNGIAATSGRRPQMGTGSTAMSPNPQVGHGWVQMSRDGVTPLADAPDTDEFWYDGFEDDLHAEKIDAIIMQHGRRRGLPLPGSPAFNAAPWAVCGWEWVAEQKVKAATPGYRPLAILEHGADAADNVVLLHS
jgi:hypothetical protein